MKVAHDLIQILERCTIDDKRLTMPPLDAAVYKRVNEVLASAGGSWNRKAPGPRVRA